MPQNKELKKVLFLIALILLIGFSAASKVYQPDPVNDYYPEIIFQDKSSGKAQWDSLKGGNSTELRSAYQLAPFGDFNGNKSIRIPIRTTSGSPYLKVNNRTSAQDYYGLDDEASSDKPKSGMIMSIGRIDDDGTDVLFVNQNGVLSYIDQNTYQDLSIQVSGAIGSGDVDRDGYEEIAFIGGSKGIKYYNYKSDDSDSSTQSFGASANSKEAVSTLADIDKDGRLEVAYQSGSSTLKAVDASGEVNSRFDDGLGNIKAYTMGVLWFDKDNYPEVAVSGNSNEMYFCNYDGGNGDCQQTGNSNDYGTSLKKTKGTRSYIPVFTKTPETNATDGTIEKGKTIKVRFNATDWEGYKDIVNSTAKVKFEGPDSYSKTVNAVAFTKESKVNGSSKAGGFVPEDGKTKAFKATLKIPDSSSTGTWNATAIAKDEHLTGTINWTTFEVKKSLIEKNFSQQMKFTGQNNRKSIWEKLEMFDLSVKAPQTTSFKGERIFSRGLLLGQNAPRKIMLYKTLAENLALGKTLSNRKHSLINLAGSYVLSQVLEEKVIFPRNSATKIILSEAFSAGKISYSTFSQGFDFSTVAEQGAFSALFELALELNQEEKIDKKISRSDKLPLTFSDSIGYTSSLGRSYNFLFDFIGSEDRKNRLDRKTTEIISQKASFSNPGSYKLLEYSYRLSKNPVRGFIGVGRIFETKLMPSVVEKRLFISEKKLTQTLGLQTGPARTSYLSRIYQSGITSHPVMNSQRIIFNGLNYVLLMEEFRDSDKLAARSENAFLTLESVLGRESSLDRSEKLSYRLVSSRNVFNGMFKSVYYIMQLGESKSSESSKERLSNQNLIFSSFEKSSKSVFRLFQQDIGIELGLEELIDYIMEFLDSDSSDTSSDSGFFSDFSEPAENKSSKDRNRTQVNEKKNLSDKENYNRTIISLEDILEVKNRSLIFDLPERNKSVSATIKYRVYSSSEKIISKNTLNISEGKKAIRKLRTNDLQISKVSGVIKYGNRTRKFSKNFDVEKTTKKSTEKGRTERSRFNIGSDEISVLLILASLFLLRNTILSFLFSIDLKTRKAYLALTNKLIHLRRRMLWRFNSSVNREEYEIANEVNSLENRKELLEYRKSKTMNELENLQGKEKLYREQIRQLSEKIRAWRETLEKNRS